MSQRGIVPVDQLWLSIRREAESVLASDPMFGASVSAAILDHRDFGGALSHQIGERLGRNTADRQRYGRIASEVFQASPDLVDAASRDLQSIVANDPARPALLPPLLNFKDSSRCKPGAYRTGFGGRTASISLCCCKACRRIRFR